MNSVKVRTNCTRHCEMERIDDSCVILSENYSHRCELGGALLTPLENETKV